MAEPPPLQGQHPGYRLYRSDRRWQPTLLICFADPIDQFLRRVSVDMIEQAWQVASKVVDGFGLDPQECRWGWAHSGVMGAARTIPVDSALDGFGWLLPDESLSRLGLETLLDEEFWVRLREIDKTLVSCDPPLMLVYSHYRCYEWVGVDGVAISPADASTGHDLTFVTLLMEMSDWRPRGDVGDGPWADIARAMSVRDVAGFHCAVSAALREYSPTGAEIVLRGFGDFLFGWSSYERNDQP
ncbi:MAG: hypothetical protein U0Q03_00245 [Acidimicrobiales bacterium]